MNADRYRADIDGLRAVAVTAVMFYHAKIPGFAGGYVGVDVFFVISGFLITEWLEHQPDGYTIGMLGSFYLRRARRLLPALLALLGVSAVVAIVLFLPADLRNFGRSLALAAASLGNVGAWLDGGYFDSGERFTPLRHLWSIGVEELFYLAYPACLMMLFTYEAARRRAAVLIAAAALLSLPLSRESVPKASRP